jgi:hypothetical protein
MTDFTAAIIQWVTLLAALSTIIGFVSTHFAKSIKRNTDAAIAKVIKDYLSELKPNGGGSMRDEVKGIRAEMTDVKTDLARLEGKFEQHITEQNI